MMVAMARKVYQNVYIDSVIIMACPDVQIRTHTHSQEHTMRDSKPGDRLRQLPNHVKSPNTFRKRDYRHHKS